MESKATAFVEQFGATLFTQWTQQVEPRYLFWDDPVFLRNVLEEGVAKLPKVPVKGHLVRELSRFVDLLRSLLLSQYTSHVTARASSANAVTRDALFSEEDVERALATATSVDEAVRLAGILSLEDGKAKVLVERTNAATTSAEYVEVVEQCVKELNVLGARRYVSAPEAKRQSAFLLQEIARCVHAITGQWSGQGRASWMCDVKSKLVLERERLCVLLHAVVAKDLVISDHKVGNSDAWTSFFQPEESATFRSLDYSSERAKIYGSLLSLALSFPVVHEEADDNTSSDDSSDWDDGDADVLPNRNRASHSRAAQFVDCVSIGKRVARQIVLASNREARSVDWLIAVLVAFQRHATPARLASVDDESDDEGEGALSPAQRHALHDTLADLYSRAFTGSSSLWPQRQGIALLRALLCLRHAAEFMRNERKQTLPVITSAMTELVGVALPSSFWRWIGQVKKVYSGEHADVQTVMKRLTKSKVEKKMAHVFMNDSVVTLAEFYTLVQEYETFLMTENERNHFAASRPAVVQPESAQAKTSSDSLFFIDQAGGNQKSKKQNGSKRFVTKVAAQRNTPESAAPTRRKRTRNQA